VEGVAGQGGSGSEGGCESAAGPLVRSVFHAEGISARRRYQRVRTTATKAL